MTTTLTPDLVHKRGVCGPAARRVGSFVKLTLTVLLLFGTATAGPLSAGLDGEAGRNDAPAITMVSPSFPPLPGRRFPNVTYTSIRRLLPEWMPPVANLDLGFDNRWRPTPWVGSGGPISPSTYAGQIYFDFQPTVKQDSNRRLFLEFHGRRPITETFRQGRGDYALGGGYRRLVSKNSAVGINSFADIVLDRGATRPSWRWGVEFAHSPAPSFLVDVSADVHANPLTPLSALRPLPWGSNRGWEVRIGATRLEALGAADVRVEARRYRFNHTFERADGWNLRVGLSVPELSAGLTYEYGRDHYKGYYHLALGAIHLPFDSDRLLGGRIPFEPPEPAPAHAPVRMIREFLQKAATGM